MLKKFLRALRLVLQPNYWRLHWLALLTADRNIKFCGYLGEFTVMINPLYPIEQKMFLGSYEKVTIKIIEKFVRPGDVCFDIGANVGAITFALARASGEKGRIFAFEPGPPIYERLKNNMALNPTLNEVVRILPLGVSDHCGYLNWAEDANNRGNGGLLDTEGIRVPVTTLDEFCQHNALPRLNFIKIDVEGMEYEVLKGAGFVLRNLHPILYFESLAPFAAFRGFNVFSWIEQLLKGHDYTLFKITDKNANIVVTTSADFSANTLALPNKTV